MVEDIRQRESNRGRVIKESGSVYRLEIPSLPKRQYGLVQLDNYMHLSRPKFPHRPSVRLQMEAKVSRNALPGTWGFGFWNDPFSFGFGAGGMTKLLPVLPNAAWFFYGSHPNCLSLRDDLPGAGFHMKTFRSPLLPSIFSVLALPILPLLLWPAAARYLRSIAGKLVEEDARTVSVDVTGWHQYQVEWNPDRVTFAVDQQECFCTRVSPQGALGLVIWIDNQYFCFNPDGRIRFGFLQTDTQECLMVRNILLISGSREDSTITKH